MDISAFSDKKTGRLVPVTIGGPDWAFIPDPLPERWEVPVRLWPLLAEAKSELSRLDGIGQALPNPELLLRPLQSREAIRSSSLEGTYASPEELLLFELESAEEQENEVARHAKGSDWREVSNYAAAVRIGAARLETLPLSLRLIREMHAVLLTGVRGRDRSPGEFRRSQVHIGADRRYVPPPANEFQTCLDVFEKFLHRADAIDPLVRTFMAHYQFEAIHPFVDGNGRVGRALLSLTAFTWCGLSQPWLYVSPFFDRHRDEYIDALFAVSAKGEWERWISLCLRATIDVSRDAVARCKRLLSLRADYQQKAENGGPRAHRIVEGLFTNPIVRTADLARRLGVTYPTAKVDIDKLAGLNVLVRLPAAHPTAFVALEIFKAAYDEPEA